MNSLPQFFVDSISIDSISGEKLDERVLLSKQDAHHAVRVLRLKTGDIVRVVHSSSQTAFKGELCIENNGASVFIKEKIGPEPSIHRPSSVRGVHTLIFALSKGNRNEVVIDNAVQLGVRRIILWQSDRSIVRLHSEKDVAQKQSKFEKVAVAAAKQSKQLALPEVEVLKTKESLKPVITPFSGPKLQCSLSLYSTPIWNIELCPDNGVMLAIGPEGDFTPQEEEWLRKNDFQPVSLGDNILTSDTAAIVSMAMVIGLYGKLAAKKE